jgi:hypothetical protein
MAFELTVEYESPITELKPRLEAELLTQGISVEICPGFTPDKWRGGFLPMKLLNLPDHYLFGLGRLVQISGFEVSFTDSSAHFRSAMGRPIAELILLCHSAAALAVISNGVYHDPQTGEAIPANKAVARAKQEILAYVPYLDERARTQHPFTQWSDYTQ